MNRPENAARPLALPPVARASTTPVEPQHAAAMATISRHAGATVTMGPQLLNIHRLMPEAILSLFGIIVMIADPFQRLALAKESSRLGMHSSGTILALASVHLMDIARRASRTVA